MTLVRDILRELNDSTMRAKFFIRFYGQTEKDTTIGFHKFQLTQHSAKDLIKDNAVYGCFWKTWEQ